MAANKRLPSDTSLRISPSDAVAPLETDVRRDTLQRVRARNAIAIVALSGRLKPRRLFASLLLGLFLAACAVAPSPPIARVALLAPFEGRYREIGYNALYAARLALREAPGPQPDLLPVDDGGSLLSAVQRAGALALDPSVQVVIAVGYNAADPPTQAALGDLPVVIPGAWTTLRARTFVFLLSDPTLADALTLPSDADVISAASAPAPLVGGDVLALAQYPRLRDELTGVTLLTVGQLPDADFTTRYQNGDPFAPSPNVLALLTYDATTLAASAAYRSLGAANPRAETAAGLAAADFAGLSGQIVFEEGVWRDAPRHAFQFDATGQLVAVEDLIE